MENNKRNLLKEYWYLWLILLILPLVLYVLIIQPWGLNAIGNENAPSVWLGFWGSYLGAIITSIAAFIILYKQIETNRVENEENRKNNEEQNKKNRAIQLKNIEHQQQMQWLNDFKRIAAEYVMAFNNTNLVIAVNNLGNQNPDEAYHITRKIFDDLKLAKTKMDFYKGDDENAIALDKKLKEKYNNFVSVVQDIHCLSSLMLDFLSSHMDGIETLKKIREFKDNFSDSIRKLIPEDMDGIGVKEMIILAKQRRTSVEDVQKDVSNLLVAYTKAEQERIDKILLDL